MTALLWSSLLSALVGVLGPLGVATPSAASGGSGAAPGRAALPGRTIDFRYDGSDVKKPRAAYTGRVFVHHRLLSAGRPSRAPLVVFLHGLNKELIAHRWMGGGNEGDVRRIVSDLVDQGVIEPAIVAGPGSVVPEAVSRGASFVDFDLDRFVELSAAALDEAVEIDRARIVVTGHSGAGCSATGGLASAPKARSTPLAVISIDTCMPGALARALGNAPARTHVVVTWQNVSWSRSFDHFRQVFTKELASNPPEPGILRELDQLPAKPRAHDATVGQTFEKWLPRILPPAVSPP